jgi:serpin B
MEGNYISNHMVGRPVMSKAASILIAICVILTLSQCSEKAVVPEENPAPKINQSAKELAGRSNTFGFTLFKEIIEQNDTANIFISPLSVSMALGMTMNGANGNTRAEMEEMLGFAGLTEQEINENYKELIEFLSSLDPDVLFEIANSIWIRQGWDIEQAFLDVNETYFNAETRELDFNDPGALDTINGWVDEKTHGKIEKIINEIPPEIMMYLINAIYFKGAWTYQFDPNETFDGYFHLDDGNTVPCRMINRHDTEEMYYRAEDFKVLELPYGNGDYSMVMLLPDADVELNDLIGRFSDENWDAWMSSLVPTEIDVTFPKFKIEYEIKLNEILKALGMVDAFDGTSADLNGIVPCNCLYIDFVKHKTFVEVDEEGTEAAAVTVVGVGYTSTNPDYVFFADRPFAFAIRESRSGSIVFMGKVGQPEFD